MLIISKNSFQRALALAVLALWGMLASSPADAACTPAAGNNVTATCTGTTVNQGGGAPGTSTSTIGYGTGGENNLTTSVVTGASVTGANYGIGFFSGSVANSGSIIGVAGILSNTIATVTNSGTITGTTYGIAAVSTISVTNSGTIATQTFGNGAIFSLGDAVTVTNSGTVAGGQYGIHGVGTTVTNSGTISGFFAVFSDGDGSVTNSGTINGLYGIYASTGAVVTNSGTIEANNFGITIASASTPATVTNSGTILAGGTGIYFGANGAVTNSGTIIGLGGTAIKFNAYGTPASDSLTVLPGARFGGLVDFGGGADTVKFGPGSWILNTANFDATLSSVVTSGNPYFVTPNQIIVADVSGFGAQNRAIMDITGWINSVLPDAPVFAPGSAGGGANSFAATDTASDPFAAFASFPPDGSNALGYAKAPVFKAASVAYADGSAVWTKGFGGQRQQDTVGNFIGGTTTGYGGAIGYERVLDPDLKIGALVGAGSNKTNLYLSAGSTSTDTVFGGAYGRRTWGATFLDLAVIGGNLDNSNTRNIGGGLALQTATASYGGWFVDPSLMIGHRIDIDGRGFTVTPALKARYIAAHFDGYSETGSTANLTVGGRDFQAVEERAEITFANTSRTASGSLVTVRVGGGILGQQRSTGGAVNIALLGQNFLAATPDRGSIAGGYGSAGLDWQIGRITLFAAGEATSTNDAARTIAGKGGVRVSW